MVKLQDWELNRLLNIYVDFRVSRRLRMEKSRDFNLSLGGKEVREWIQSLHGPMSNTQAGNIAKVLVEKYKIWVNAPPHWPIHQIDVGNLVWDDPIWENGGCPKK